MKWDIGLDSNSIAYAIASDPSKKIRIIAGPGTGKSFALKRRVSKLLEDNINPEKILAVTFTRVAAEDLYRELTNLHIEGCENICAKTLHAFSLSILQKQNVLAVTGRVPRPLNKFEVDPLLADLKTLKNITANKTRLKKLIKDYESAWARTQQAEPACPTDAIDIQFESALLDWLIYHRAMLIGEVIPQLHNYLKNNPHAPELIFYDHVLVDEYQDLNKVEQSIVNLLTKDANICIVGDDDQSIYSFKNANPDGIRDFTKTYPDTKEHELLECYRCPTTIVSIANSLISKNQSRKTRVLHPVNGNGSGVLRIIQYENINTESVGIAKIVKEFLKNSINPSDILILTQRDFIANLIFQSLQENNIPVKSYYQESEVNSKIAQEKLSILRLIAHNDDRVSLRWLLGSNHTTYNAKNYSHLKNYCEQNTITPWEVLVQLEAGKIEIKHTASLLARFREIKEEINQLQAHLSLESLVKHWLPETQASLKKLRELALKLLPASKNIEEFLDKINLELIKPEIPLELSDVRIMSLHKSKGLSAPIVIIAGCVEGLLPQKPADRLTDADKKAYLEEQRRLFYVGITRTKADVKNNNPGTLILTSARTLSFANAKTGNITFASHCGSSVVVHASRFLKELGSSAPATEKG